MDIITVVESTPARGIVTYLVPTVPIFVALLVTWLTFRQWRLTFFTKEWSELVKHLQTCPRFMDPEKTSAYKSSFTGDDLIQYELVARQCVAFLDDMFHVGYIRPLQKRMLRNWYKGSTRLLAGRHRAWLQDNSASYSPTFYAFLFELLEEEEKQRQ